MASLAALNLALAAADARDDARRIGARAETVGAVATRELLLLKPLPDDAYDVSLSLSCKVDAKARVCARQSYYSVPARFAGRRLEVRLGATAVVALDAGKPVATHTRSLHKGSEDLMLDHYLEVLGRKSGAMAGSTALVSARAAGVSTPVHQRFWDAAHKHHGDGPGTRALVGVLLLHRTPDAAAGMESALMLGGFNPRPGCGRGTQRDARLHRCFAAGPGPGAGDRSTARDDPAPSLAKYDQLLTEATA